jgi:serine/threonine-protein kinase
MANLQDTLSRAIGDRYAIERELGHGGMATVFLARDVKHRRPVALKVLRQDVSVVLGAERFLREIEIAASLQHPHILPLHDSGEFGGILFYVMPYVEGESLRSRLARERTLSIEDALSITREVADALAYAHHQGVVHRDIKPENILLSGSHAVVADFGIARAITSAGAASVTGTGIVVGTPAYMSPEQVAGDQALDGRADIYALGCVLYECLTGRPPFSGGSAAAVFAQQLTATPSEVRRARQDVSARLQTTINRALAKNPTERFASASEFASALSVSAGPGESRARHIRLSLRSASLLFAAVVIAAAGGVYARHALQTGGTPIHSLAVMPFRNESAEPDNEYFADGMTEELIGAFRRLPGLRVPPRSSVFALKGLNLLASDVGRRLKMDMVLEGSVLRSSGLVRLNAELVDVAADTTIWSESYQNALADPFSIQDTLARQIVARLGPRLHIAGSTSLVHRGTRDRDAYDLYLKGRYAMVPRTQDGLIRAIDFFQQAVSRDTTYALAYSGLADAYGLVAAYSGAVSPQEGFTRARAAASRALALDAGSPEAHTSAAFASLFYDYDWKASEREVVASIRLDSTYAFAHIIAGWMYAVTNRPVLAVRELQTARQLEPVSAFVNTRLGSVLYYAGDVPAAIAQLRKALEIDSTFTLAHVELARSLANLGRVDEAVAELSRAPDFAYRYEAAPVIYAIAKAGRTAEAKRRLAERLALAQRSHIDPVGNALIYVGLGETDEAFKSLAQARRDRPWSLALIGIEPLWAPVAKDPRFIAILHELRLSDRADATDK